MVSAGMQCPYEIPEVNGAEGVLSATTDVSLESRVPLPKASDLIHPGDSGRFPLRETNRESGISFGI